MEKSFVIKGNICQTKNPKELDLHEGAFVVCTEGVSRGVFDALPEEYRDLPLYDYGDALIFPGMVGNTEVPMPHSVSLSTTGPP